MRGLNVTYVRTLMLAFKITNQHVETSVVLYEFRATRDVAVSGQARQPKSWNRGTIFRDFEGVNISRKKNEWIERKLRMIYGGEESDG